MMNCAQEVASLITKKETKETKCAFASISRPGMLTLTGMSTRMSTLTADRIWVVLKATVGSSRYKFKNNTLTTILFSSFNSLVLNYNPVIFSKPLNL